MEFQPADTFSSGPFQTATKPEPVLDENSPSCEEQTLEKVLVPWLKEVTAKYLERVMTSSENTVGSQSLDGKKIRRLYHNLFHYSSRLYALILSTKFISRSGDFIIIYFITVVDYMH